MLKSVREREGVTAHMVARIGAEPGERRPVPHRVVPEVVPADAFRGLLAHLPHGAHFEPVAGPRRAGRRRRFLLAAPDIHTLPADEARFWSDVARLFDGPRLREALLAGPAAPARVTLERTAPGVPLVLSEAGQGADILFALVLPAADGGPVRLALARRGLSGILAGGRPRRRAVGENTGLVLSGSPGGAAPVARLEPAPGSAVTVLLARYGGAAAAEAGA